MMEMTEYKEPKYDGFDEYKVRHAAEILKEAVELGEEPKLLEAAKKWLKEEKMRTREAVGLADNL